MHHALPQRILVIANPGSGQGEPVLAPLNRHFRTLDLSWDLRITHQFGDGARLAREALDRGVDMIAVYGGDGTVMDVAAALANTNVPLLILPGGTGNLVAAELELPRELDRALSRLAPRGYESRLIDVGRMGQRNFLLRIGCGIETGVIHDAKPEWKKQFGRWAYVFATAKALQEVQSADYRIILDDEHEITGQGVALAVANAGTVGLGDLGLSPRIGIADGKLDVVFLRKADAEGIMHLVVHMIDRQPATVDTPRIDASHLVNHWQARKVRIETNPVLEIQADGDVIGHTPQTVEVLPSALRVVI